MIGVVLVCILAVLLVMLVLRLVGFARVRRLFSSGNTCVFGLRGRGKDMLMSNIAVRQKRPYVSNIDYGSERIPLDFKLLCVPTNFEGFINGTITPYDYPYPEKSDIFVSDAGIYLPCQYNDKLNRNYAGLTTFAALSRHLGDCNIHYNTQALNRVWDKFREQCDCYIMAVRCKVIFGFVFQTVRVYERYDAAEKCVPPCRFKAPLFGSTGKTMARIEQQKYELTYGKIKTYRLLYRNKSSYDTRIFKTLMKGCQNCE